MTSPIGVVGAGAVGCYVGACLSRVSARPVVFLGRNRLVSAVKEKGLHAQNFSEAAKPAQPGNYRVTTNIDELGSSGILLFCVKSKDTEACAKRLAPLVGPECLVVSLQNGLSNAEMLRRYFKPDHVVAGIVDFNVRELVDGIYQKTTSGGITLEKIAHPTLAELESDLERSDVPVVLHDDIARAQWTKLLVNLNNAVSALTDAPTRDLVARADLRRLVASVVEEGYRVAKASGVRPARLRGVPVAWMPAILRLPNFLAHHVTRAQMKIDPNARSSMWEDLRRGRSTEINWLNGEIVRRGKELGVAVPINERIVKAIREAEAQAQGSPKLGASELYP